MRKRTLGVVLVAGLAMSGAGAFTGSNDVTAAATNTAGYGSVTATGVTVTDVDFTSLSTDESKVDSITFYSSDNVEGKVARLSLQLTAGTNVAYSCTETWTAPVVDINGVTTADGYTTILCDVTDNRGYTEFESVGLTVLDA